ncbi:hypothetical protein N801_17145 [Knoellia aerolata DSM 18566]|uniref:Glycosyltransferase 2-like domain-containing protein n=2 Tax=Knoellia TaxID=136099 RepID=A0A0A0K235_9MICO|nr:hypothetical protein N801_17145 [Knoellia aerolata DSM 18566]
MVVDNASPGRDFEDLVAEFDDGRIAVVRSPSNGGYAVGNNFGWREAMRRWPTIETLIISNPDVTIDSSSLNEVLAAVRPRGEFDAAAPLIVDRIGNASQYFAWPLPTYFDVLLSTSVILSVIRQRLGFHSYAVPAGAQAPFAVDVLPGACFAISAEAFERVQGFDEQTFLFCEENMLAHRLKARGMRSAIVPKATAFHQVSSSVRRSFKGDHVKFALAARSYDAYLRHYLDSPRVLVFLYRAAVRFGYVERIVLSRVRRPRP